MAKNQHYSRLVHKSNHKTKTTLTIIEKEAGNVHSMEHVPTLLDNDGKLKEPTDMAKAFSNLFITITEKNIE
jgi:hypothetical protein